MNISAVLFLLTGKFNFSSNQKTKNSQLLIIYFGISYLLILLPISLLRGNDIILSSRFFLILFLIGSASFLSGKIEYIKIFMSLITIQSLVLIFGEIVFLSTNIYNPVIRNTSLSMGWGDIYKSGLFYKIQIKGNALIPLGLFISIVSYKTKYRRIYIILNLLGLIIAGNFAFLLGLSFFLFLIYIKRLFYKKHSLHKLNYWAIIVASSFIVLISKIYSFIMQQIKLKGIESNPTRIDQIRVMWDNLDYNLLWGNGLGNLIKKKTVFRDYSNEYYYEIQNFYVLNQIGILGFFLYLLLNLVFIKTLRNIESRFIYISYIVYSLFNPYVFDTNHLIAIICCASLDVVIDKKNLKILKRSCEI